MRRGGCIGSWWGNAGNFLTSCKPVKTLHRGVSKYPVLVVVMVSQLAFVVFRVGPRRITNIY